LSSKTKGEGGWKGTELKWYRREDGKKQRNAYLINWRRKEEGLGGG